MKIKQFCKEILSDTGSYSMTRFLSLSCVFTSIFIAIYTLFHDGNLDATIGIISTFLAAGIGGKVIQRFAEVKENIEDEKSKS